MSDFATWMRAQGARTEAALDSALPSTDTIPHTLHEAMRYAVLGGGKRVRPLLVHAAGEVAGATPEACDAAACAVEMILPIASSNCQQNMHRINKANNLVFRDAGNAMSIYPSRTRLIIAGTKASKNVVVF